MSDKATQPDSLNNTSPDMIFALHAAAMRESSEPRDGISPAPVSYLLCCFFWLLWGGWYLGYYGGEWSGNGLAERSAGGPAIVGPPQNPMVLGKEVFGACMQCHQENGKGVEGSYPPLAGSEYVLGDKRRLAAILLNGLTGEFVVKGKTYNSEMPTWAVRDDEEIAAVLTYVRASWGNKADPVSKEFVAAVRKEIDGKGGWKAASLEAFAASAPPAAATTATPPSTPPVAK